MSVNLKIDFIHEHVVIPAFELLPKQMQSREAEALLIAIGLQESRFRERRQIKGPARGFWQFEQAGGVTGVLTHPASKVHAVRVVTELGYAPNPAVCYAAIEHNDILAAVFARLLLWTLPEKLASHAQADRGWQQYVSAWRPGRPHRDTWNSFFLEGWSFADSESFVYPQ